MFKITAIEAQGQQTLVLEGKLVDPWLAELERTWNEMRCRGDSKMVIDLKDVTAISERGEVLLRQMMAEGAKFNCCRGVLTRHVVQRSVDWCKAQGAKKGVKR